MKLTVSRTLSPFAAFAALALLPAPPAAAAERKAEAPVIAEERLGPMSLALDPQIVYETATLRIVGPEGYEVRKRFAGGAPIVADLLGDRAPVPRRQREERSRAVVGPTAAEPGMLADGRYHYEAVFMDATGEEKVVSGLFFVEGGVAISREQIRGRLTETRSELRDRERMERSTQDGLTKVTAAVTTANDGVSIVDAAQDGFTFLTLESNANPPDNADWSWGNGVGVFSLVEDPGTVVRATVLPGGKVGIGTTAPATRLHLRDANGFQLRLDTGLAFMDLDLFGPGLAFRDKDDEPIVRFNPSAPPDRLVVTGGGVGIDTGAPGGNLHIFGAAGADIFSAVGPDPEPGGNALNFGYSGATFGVGSGFFNVRPEGAPPNPALYFATGDVERMLIDNQGFIGIHLDGELRNTFNPAHPIHASTSGAHLTAGGIWTNASSRELKERIVPLGAEAALAALAKLEPVSFRYKLEPEDEHVGFIAEEVPELVANPDRKTLSPMDVVAVLTRVVQEQQRTVGEQQRTVGQQLRTVGQQQRMIAALSRRVEELEQSSKPE